MLFRLDKLELDDHSSCNNQLGASLEEENEHEDKENSIYQSLNNDENMQRNSDKSDSTFVFN